MLARENFTKLSNLNPAKNTTPVEDSFPWYLRSINKRQQRSSGVRDSEDSSDLNHSDDRESKVLRDIGVTMARNSDEPVVAVIRSDFTVIRCNGVSIGENILRSSCLPLAGTKVGNKEANESHANARTRVHTYIDTFWLSSRV